MKNRAYADVMNKPYWIIAKLMEDEIKTISNTHLPDQVRLLCISDLNNILNALLFDKNIENLTKIYKDTKPTDENQFTQYNEDAINDFVFHMNIRYFDPNDDKIDIYNITNDTYSRIDSIFDMSKNIINEFVDLITLSDEHDTNLSRAYEDVIDKYENVIEHQKHACSLAYDAISDLLDKHDYIASHNKSMQSFDESDKALNDYKLAINKFHKPIKLSKSFTHNLVNITSNLLANISKMNIQFETKGK